MAEKPILFSTDMVRAILEGRKTQTRRVIKPQPNDAGMLPATNWRGEPEEINVHDKGLAPYSPGDILWVRETWNGDWCDHVIYKADGGSAKAAGYSAEPKWKPSIHMPRTAARILLRVTDVQVERLRKISNADAIAESFAHVMCVKKASDCPHLYDYCDDADGWNHCFAAYWEKLNAKRGYGWDANPWVWVYTFKRVDESEVR